MCGFSGAMRVTEARHLSYRGSRRGSVRAVRMSLRGRFGREIIVTEVEAGDRGGRRLSGILGATGGGAGVRRGGVVGTRGCAWMMDSLRRGVLWVATRTGLRPWVDRFATPERVGGVWKRLEWTGVASRRWGGGGATGVRVRGSPWASILIRGGEMVRGSGRTSRSHSARAPLTLHGSASSPRRTLSLMTVTRGGEVARGVRVRGSRWAGGLIRGAAAVPDTKARSTCEGGGLLPATAWKRTMAEKWACRETWREMSGKGVGGPVPTPASGRMHGRTRAAKEEAEGGGEEEEGEKEEVGEEGWRSARGGLGTK